MNGSGTTMLADSLGNHPELYIFPRETRILPYFINKLPSFGDLSELTARRKLANALGKSFPFWIENNKKPVILDNNELNKSSFSGIADSMFKYFATQYGKMRWGEKSPMYLMHIGLLGDYFPESQFIHIYRDGRDVAQSFQRRWKKNPRWTIYRWKKIIKTGNSQGVRLGKSRYMTIKYEELTSDPERHLRQICEFLKLRYHPSLLKTSMRQMDPMIKTESIVPNSQKWRNYFSEKEIFELEKIAGQFLSELGYMVSTNKGSVDPGAWHLKWWRFFDYLKLTWTNFQKEGIRSTPIFFRKAHSAIRQYLTSNL